jgi:hypothetical protein
MNRLSQKGLVQSLKEERKTLYIPLQPAEFIGREQARLTQTLSSLQTELEEQKKAPAVSYIWNVRQYDYLIAKALKMLAAAQKEILISAWPEEIAALTPALGQSLARQVKLAIVHFGQPAPATEQLRQLFPHPIQDTIYTEKGGRCLVVVCDAGELTPDHTDTVGQQDTEALMGTIYPDNRVDGAWSMNSGFVTLAKDYIKHDIYIMKIVQRFDPLLITRFGTNYAKLRDIFTNEEVMQ